ncbi:HAD family phosphatase [Candidatus Kuenenbacteria bacterium]|nr:HAD family phosphatase [Candidatus Kuenenbacteria bacterium]
MKIEAIIFDLDGVLTDSMKFHVASWNYAFNHFHIFPSKKDFLFLEGLSYQETIEYISEKYNKKILEREKEKIYLLKKKKFSELFKFEIYPDILNFLKYLQAKNIKLGLVSGANKEFVDKIVDKFFKDIFKVIISGGDIKKGKPSPEPYLTATKKLGCNAKNIFVIENAPLGIKSATEANLKTLALTTTLDKKSLQGANKIFSSHQELIKYIKNITGAK